ncbi:hypothetical protein OC709_01925 ['Planchonia careya' phytoplasma]|nr:hypothetical protein ['Planchonia careya' phytoplasma]MDO8030260.1 hypothetical protein ['Planchonia careya' phytoplasma]
MFEALGPSMLSLLANLFPLTQKLHPHKKKKGKTNVKGQQQECKLFHILVVINLTIILTCHPDEQVMTITPEVFQCILAKIA